MVTSIYLTCRSSNLQSNSFGINNLEECDKDVIHSLIFTTVSRKFVPYCYSFLYDLPLTLQLLFAGELTCRICDAKFQTSINNLTGNLIFFVEEVIAISIWIHIKLSFFLHSCYYYSFNKSLNF